MKKNLKKWACIALAVVLTFSALPLLAGALVPSGAGTASVATANTATANGQAPLKVEIKSDKEKYTLLGKMEFTATITNISSDTVENISAEALFGTSLRPLTKGSQFTATRASLAPRASFSFTYNADLSGLKGADSLLWFFHLIGSLVHGGKANLGDNGFDDGRELVQASKSVGLLSLVSGQYDASTAVKVWFEETSVIPTTYYQSEDSNIVYASPNDSLGYVNNIILVAFKKEATTEDKLRIADSIGGTIVGKTSAFIQIKISPTNEDGLKKICQELQKDDMVSSAMYDLAIPADKLGPDAIPNDPWRDTFQGIWGTDWNEDEPSGLNWWLEAIYAPSAWDYDDWFSEITIGIVDNGFDTDHEDLNINVLNSEVNSKETHGTHVAGIIGATANNDIGITGIVWNANLLGVDVAQTKSQERKNIQVSNEGNAFRSLLDNGAKVINFSWGIKGSDLTNERVEQQSGYWTQWIYETMQELGRDDFIFVDSAGNDTKNARQNGFFASMEEQSVQEKLNELGVTSITAEDILSHVIIVGAIEKPNNGYVLTDFSNYGDNVNIVAPGRDIFSTIVMGGITGNYGKFLMDGTSMATPMVTGVAALVWSVRNNNFTAAEVKEMVCNYTVFEADGYLESDTKKYGIVNACASVIIALTRTGYLDEEKTNNVTGTVHDAQTNESLDGVTVTAYNSKNEIVGQTTTGLSGLFNLKLLAGQYTFTYSLNGYVTTTNEQAINGDFTWREPILLQKQSGGGETQSTITGKVLEQGTNAPLSGVLVQAMKTGTTIVAGSATTNADGLYSLTVERNATYDLKFTKSGYTDQIQRNVIVVDSTMVLSNVVMFPSLFAGGTGTEQDPYLVSTPAQLDAVRNNLSASYKLINDIDLGNWGDWEPIGTNRFTPFSGVFDGNRHTIKNMIVNISDSRYTVYAGLFGSLHEGAVKNTGMVNSTINIVGWGAYAGGIAGESISATITNCYNTGEVNATVSGVSNSYYITACTGGIVGKNYDTSTINNCYNTGEINANIIAVSNYLAIACTGGIAGENRSTSTINNCYNTGEISATATTVFNYGKPYAGGIAGENYYSSTINNCYNIGTITATCSNYSNTAGGIVGDNPIGEIINQCCYLNNIPRAQGTLGSGTLINVFALTETQMKQQSSFIGFDFDTVWAISPSINNGYPYLRGLQP